MSFFMVSMMKFIFFNLSLLLSLSAIAEIFEDKDLIEYSDRKYAPVFGFVVKRNESGQIVEKTFYKDGLKNGLTESFHSADQASAVGEFLMNEREGPWSWYRPDGSLQRAGQYAKGLWEGEWHWYDEAGRLTMKKKYRNGKEEQ